MLLSNLDLLATAPGGVAKLRELILTLAVQGKLVPQDPADEPAGVLLQQIRAEKDRLVAEGKIKRDKPLAEIAEEEKPFELPVGWEWVRWANVAMKIGDIDHKMPSEAKDGVPYVSPRDFYGTNEIDFDGAKKIAYSDYVELASKIRPEAADLIYPRYGTVGVVRKVTTDREFLASYSCAVIKVLPGFIEPDYQYLFSVSGCAKAQAASATNKTTQPNVGLKSIQEFLVPLPPLAEQSRIVTRVEALMRLCDALEAKGQLEAAQHAQLVSTLLGTLTASTTPEELAAHWQRVAQHFDLLLDRPEAIDALEQTLLQLAVRGLLVPQDPTDEPASALLQKIRAEKDRLIATGQIKRDKPLPPITDEEKPFELPVGWEWVRLGSLGESFDYGSSQKSVDDSAAVPILRMGNIQGGRVVMTNLKYLKDLQGELPCLLLREGDLLFNRTNSYELVGKTGLFEGYAREMTFASYLIRIRLMDGLVNSEYINAYMNTRDCRESEIEPDLTQQTGQANYNGTKLKSIRVPLPPLAEQSRIVTRVTAQRRLCADLRQRLAERQSVQARLAEALVGAASLSSEPCW
ncbi:MULTISPECIES: restriction endonuclease subunit S [unclassified Acidovorax]|uniref:restriction endonuclease subunit S n=1 Tax=unclassified Acidovorax TaxID=2684926 RepID=UPI002882E3ED|nr:MULTISPECIES: restriction endonuclease subunit S [unclassified Acidovorax]